MSLTKLHMPEYSRMCGAGRQRVIDKQDPSENNLIQRAHQFLISTVIQLKKRTWETQK